MLAPGLNELIHRKLVELGYLRYQWQTPFITKETWDSTEQDCICIAAKVVPAQESGRFSVSHCFVNRSISVGDLSCVADKIPLDMEDSIFNQSQDETTRSAMQEVAVDMLEAQNSLEENSKEETDNFSKSTPPPPRMVLAIDSPDVSSFLCLGV